ncbi:MAG TPA: ATP synthase F1 subunit delta [Vicinamibacterales bacterium]|nr:ATP synthase F1 subunit delta [Vicinamibacterales bacterium]
MSMRASAARYARALLDVTITESDPVAAEADLAAFVDLVQRHPDLQRTFAHPVVSASAKRALVQQILNRTQPSAPVGKLLLLLATRGRLELVREILDVYRERLMEHRQVIQAEVTTAAPLSPERIAELQQRLVKITGRTVTMTTKVDQTIIGGVVTRIGSTVYDGSIATQLAKVRHRLSERS